MCAKRKLLPRPRNAEIFYLYRHIRLDTNQVFYIGIGSTSKHKRAFNTSRRSFFWKNIVNTTEYIVEIILDNLSKEQAIIKEKEFIKLYGRRDLKNGTLCNMTNGGEGVLGYKHSQERLLKISNNNKGGSNPNSKICIHFNSKQEYSNLKQACNILNFNYASQASAIKRQSSTAQFYYKNSPFSKKTKQDITNSLSLYRNGKKSRENS